MSNIWTAQDALNGLCDFDDVGSAKCQAPDASSPTSLDDLIENSITPKTQAEFNKWKDANPGVYFPMLAKHNLARIAKEQPVKLPDLDSLSPTDMEVFSSNDIKMMLLKSVGISKKSELSG